MPALAFSAQAPEYKTPEEKIIEEIDHLEHMIAQSEKLTGKAFCDLYRSLQAQQGKLIRKIKIGASFRSPTPPMSVCKKK